MNLKTSIQIVLCLIASAPAAAQTPSPPVARPTPSQAAASIAENVAQYGSSTCNDDDGIHATKYAAKITGDQIQLERRVDFSAQGTTGLFLTNYIIPLRDVRVIEESLSEECSLWKSSIIFRCIDDRNCIKESHTSAFKEAPSANHAETSNPSGAKIMINGATMAPRC